MNYPDTYGRNPQFLLYVDEDGDVSITLTQAAETPEQPLASIALQVVDKQGKRVDFLYAGELVVDSGDFQYESSGA